MKNNNLRIKKELDIVYITSSGDRYLKEMDAYAAESQIQQVRDYDQKKIQVIMNTVELLMRVLKMENWGVYYKNSPMQALEMKDGAPLYKINQVDEDEIENAIKRMLTCKENTQTNYQSSEQNENSKTG